MPQLATAQDMSRAQTLFQSGVDMADAERWGEAAEYFRQARAIVERPSIVCNLGVALHHLGETTDAIEALQRCRALAQEDAAWGASNRALVERAGRLLDELRPSMGRLTLTIAPDETEVFLDGTPLEGTGATRSLELDPGRHRLTLSAAGYMSRTEEIRAARFLLSVAFLVLATGCATRPGRLLVVVYSDLAALTSVEIEAGPPGSAFTDSTQFLLGASSGRLTLPLSFAIQARAERSAIALERM